MDKPKLMRVRPAWQGGTCAVRHPEHGEHVVPDPRATFRADDPVVVAYPWLFVSADDATPEPAPVVAVRVEDASARPGARRGASRR